MKSLELGLVVGLAFVLGCTTTSSPQPLPPPDINSAFLAIVDGGDDTVTVTGEPGAVSNGETIRVTNPGIASGQGSEAEGAVTSDGSFSVTLGGVLGDEYRLQAANSTAATEPLDVEVDPDTGAVSETKPNTCLSVSPALLDLGEVPLSSPQEANITIANSATCEAIVVVDIARSLGESAWDNSVAIPMGGLDIAPGGSTLFELRYEAQDHNTPGAPAEELFVVDAEGATIPEHEYAYVTARATPVED